MHGTDETVLYRADPSALKQTALGAPFAPWFRIPLGTLMKHCWVSGGKLYGVTVTAWSVYRLDEEIDGRTSPAMTGQARAPWRRWRARHQDGADYAERRRDDHDGRTRRRPYYMEDRNRGPADQERKRQYSPLRVADYNRRSVHGDRHVRRATKIDAALLIARWSQERKQ